eukprot:Skav219713  [mRNA]  locus=scaffold301:7199:13358:+ [translate_table: standard]
MLPLIVVAMAVSAHGVSVPDIVSIGMAPIDWCLELLHGKHLRTPQWLVDQPQAQLPTVDEIDELSSSEAQQRREFYLSVLVLLFFLTVALGTAVMVFGPSLRSHSRKRAGEPEYEPFEPGQGGGLSVSFQRKLVCAAFSCIALASAAACVFSMKTDRLSKSTGLDWEVYVLLFCMAGIFFLVQALFAVLWLPAGHTFAVFAFAEAAFTGLFPVISDLFDTLKDTIFAALCFQSKHVALRIMGVASWLYLIGIHMYMLARDNTLAELAGCSLPVLLVPPEPKAAKAAQAPQGEGRFAKLLSPALFVAYKQCTPTKRELLLLENVPQALLSVAFLLVEGGSTFVLVINLAIPAAQVLATFAFFKPLLACVAPQLGKKLQGFLSKPDYLKAKHMWLEAAAGDFSDMEHNEKLLKFFRNCLGEAIENEGAIDLEKARDGREVLECWVPSGSTGIVDAAQRGRRLGAVRHFLQKDPKALRETSADGWGTRESCWQFFSFRTFQLVGPTDFKAQLEATEFIRSRRFSIRTGFRDPDQRSKSTGDEEPDEEPDEDDPGIIEAARARDLPAVRGLLRADPGAVRRTNWLGPVAQSRAFGRMQCGDVTMMPARKMK